MNQLDHAEGCTPRQYVGRGSRIEAALRCYGGGSSSSSTSQPVTNEQVGLELQQGGQGVAVGAGAQTGAINITSGDIQTAQMALAGAGTIAGQAIVSAGEQAGHAEDIVGGIAGAAINLGSQATGQAFQFAQNQTALAYNALNQNTALAFSTINALDMANAAGAVSAAAQDTLSAAQAATSGGGTGTTVIYKPDQSAPYAGQSGGMDATTVLLIAVAALAAIYFLKK
jgi:hypothetical protein